MLLENYDIEEMKPSPIKEAILRLVTRTLSDIKTHEFFSEEDESKEQDCDWKELKEQCLAKLYYAYEEMQELKETDEPTSYWQQLVDLNVLAELTRSHEEQIIQEYDFNRQDDESEEEEVTTWNCLRYT